MSLTPYQPEEYLPRLLSEAELEEPERVFASFFENFDLIETREQLTEALTLVVEKRFKPGEDTIEEDNVRFFFEKLEKLLEAACVLRE